jgi:hypothetical protein
MWGTIYRAPTTTKEKFGQPVIGLIPTIVRTYKSAIIRLAGREQSITNSWHRNYYDHIIRKEAELRKI